MKIYRKLKDERAITLIALIVTIIILILLAGITISILNNSGLIEKSKMASQETMIAKYKEKIEFVKTETILEHPNVITLENLNLAFNELKQKDWVNKSEIVNGIIKLTTNDGYLFFVTENATEYKGTGDVVIPDIITAEMIEFTPTDPTWTGISNVKDAINYLYSN